MSKNENLTKLLGEIAEKHGYSGGHIDTKPVSSDGANFSSNLFVVTISAADKEDLKLFAKVASFDPDYRTENSSVSVFFTLERIFYDELASNYKRIYDKNDVPEESRLSIPQYYGHIATDLEETMVLENLEAKGFISFDRLKTFNWEYGSKAVEQLAKFHAVNLAFREEDPEYFEQVTAQTGVNLWAVPEVQEAFLAQARRVGTEHIDEEYRERVQNFFDTNDLVGDMEKNNADRSMLIHGDYRPSNLMHRRKNGKIELVLLDFQTYRRGSPAADLVHLIFNGTDEEFRRHHFQHLLDLYYSQLGEELRRLRVEVEEVYPRKLYDQHIRDFLPFGLLTVLAMMGVVTVDPADVPDTSDDIMSMFSVTPNGKALHRIHGIVRDCVRWGVL